MPLEIQAALYEELLREPLKSYAFFSPAGWSKTTVCTALYRAAVWERCVMNPQWDPVAAQFGDGVWRVAAPLLIAQHQEYAVADPRRRKPPEVVSQIILKLGQRKIQPRLFLEEVDKFKLTEFAQNTLFNIINTVYEAEGQLVINANLTFPEFEEQFGAPITRRVNEMCVVKNYFSS